MTTSTSSQETSGQSAAGVMVFLFQGTDHGGAFLVVWVGGVYGVKGGEGDDAGSTWLHRFDGQA